jgi:aspartate/methionine/tyrosine aminotransferase
MSNNDFFNYATLEIMHNTPNSKWLRYPKDVIPLWLASPDFRIAREIKDALISAVKSDDLYYNTDKLAREAMAEKIKRVNKLEVSAEDVMITQGVDPYIWLAVREACNPGEEVILTDPIYGEFNNVLDPLGVTAKYWQLDQEEGYMFDSEKLKELIGPKTKAIGVCNPHNPTGRVMNLSELKSIADIAIDRKIKVFVDELWEDIRFDKKEHITLASLGPEIEDLTSTSWGVSKTFGVAGIYLGYVCITNPNTHARFKKYAKCIQRGSTTIARAAAPVMLNTTLDWYREEMLNHLHKIRDFCYKRCNEIPGVIFNEFEGTYVPLLKFNYDMTSEGMCEYLLNEAKVALAPGSNYGNKGEGYQRICIATSEIIIQETFERIEQALKSLSTRD